MILKSVLYSNGEKDRDNAIRNARWVNLVLRDIMHLHDLSAQIRDMRELIFATEDQTGGITRQVLERLIHAENGFTQVEHVTDVLNRSSVKMTEMDAVAQILPDVRI